MTDSKKTFTADDEGIEHALAFLGTFSPRLFKHEFKYEFSVAMLTNLDLCRLAGCRNPQSKPEEFDARRYIYACHTTPEFHAWMLKVKTRIAAKDDAK